MSERPVVAPVRDSALWTMVKIRLLEFTRKPEAIFWTYFFPLIMVAILGSAFRSQPEETLPIAIVDQPGARALMEALGQNPEFQLELLELEEAKRQLRVGAVNAVVTPTADSSIVDNTPSSSETVEAANCRIMIDNAQPNSRLAESAIRLQLQELSGNLLPVETTTFDEPGSRYVDFLVPGLIGMGLLGGGMWGVGYAIVDMRIRKLLKRFLATPMRRSDFLMAVMISRLFFILPEIAIMIGFSTLFFGIRVYGSWLALAVLIVLGAIQFSGVGLLVASRAKTMEAISGLMNLVMLPMWTLSGIFFSYERFPEFLHWPIRLLPLTPVLDALRGVMLEGRSLPELWLELLLMTIWSVVTFAIALKIFRWNV